MSFGRIPEISATVREVVAELQETLPEVVNIFDTSGDAVSINRSIQEVLKPSALAVRIVIVVIYVFLRDL